MRAITVCYQYHDILERTLSRNIHLFDSITVVTSAKDTKTIEVVERHGADLFLTEVFWDQGAVFNKFRAMEAGLDHMGREGWISIIDADVVLPQRISEWTGKPGNLYCPLRRMLPDIRAEIPHESKWKRLRFHRANEEFAGYCLIFHASDPILGPPPWHQMNWTWAGSGDSYFQLKWPQSRKVRPPFECLHLGPAGVNWAGRVTAYTDGTEDPDARERADKFSWLMRQRAENKARNLPRFMSEKLE